MFTVMRRFLVLLAATLGCNSSEFTLAADAAPADAVDEREPEADARPPLSSGEACAAAVELYCAKYESCMPLSFKTLWGTEAFCRERLALVCERHLAMKGVLGTPAEQIECADIATSGTCGEFIGGQRRCTRTPGALAVGEPCAQDYQCRTSFCQIVPGTLCGKCVEPPGDGAACVDRCATPLFACVGNVCKKRATVGQRCAADLPCVGDLVCSAGSCVEPARKAERCDGTGAVAAQCDVYNGLYCSASSTCIAYGYAEPSTACATVGSEYRLCVASGFCRVPAGTYTGTCIPAAGEGAPCNVTVGPGCVFGSACVGGICRVSDPAACE